MNNLDLQTNMANTTKNQVFLCFVVLLVLISVVRAVDDNPLEKCNFDSIYQFGASKHDTGNLLRLDKSIAAGRLPYGETFFKKPTGRWSNGRLMIDFFAMAANLPFLNPYLNKKANFRHGVNFAVAGSTALSTSVLASKNISSGSTNSSLDVQLDWMSSHFHSSCHSYSDCAKKLKNKIIAMAANLPFLNPYLNKKANFRHGVNFAVAGSTALFTSVLASKNISFGSTNSSLDVQLDWMSSHFNSSCHSYSNCAKKLKNALFMVGETGANDYNYALLPGKSIEELKSTLVPDVVQAIMDAVKRVISYGAVRMVVPGNYQIGCQPVYLTIFKTNDSSAYDKFHCLKELNKFSQYHNNQLQQGIKKLQRENPNVTIVYGDYYNSFQWVFQNARSLGFDPATLLIACCGVGGDYNVSWDKQCGESDVPTCTNPNSLISWDGNHLTQQAYKFMTLWLIRDILPKLKC